MRFAINLKNLGKEAILPSASKFLPLLAKEIPKKRHLKTLRKAIQLVLEVTRERAQVLGEISAVEFLAG